METAELVDLIEQLDDNIDDLEEALTPLLQKALSDTAGRLPLLDKAHLYVLIAYAIESLLFSYLRLNGINAREHPIFAELNRVKQYFEKIKLADSNVATPNAKLDKAAAGRMVKHALAGNKEHGAYSALQQSSAKTANHIRFENAANNTQGVSQNRPEYQVSSKNAFDAAHHPNPVDKVSTRDKVDSSQEDESHIDHASANGGHINMQAGIKEARRKSKRSHKEHKALKRARMEQKGGRSSINATLP